MSVGARTITSNCGVSPALCGAHSAEQLQRTVSALVLQFSESLELPIVLDQVACQVASLFQGVCRVQFAPAHRPADARCAIATPDATPATWASAGAAMTYAELLTRLEEYRRHREPALVHERVEGEGSARSGEDNPAAHAGAELLLAPLVARGRRLGMIEVIIPASNGSALGHDQSLLREVSAHAALAIDTADYVARHQPGADPDTAAAQDPGPMLALLAHDLRAPLATLSTSVQTLVRLVKGAGEPRAERLAQLVEVAEASVALLETQVRALTPARDSGPRTGERSWETIDLVRLTRLMTNFYQQTTARHQFSVSADVPELPGRWARSHLERVLGNLLLNGIKYSPDGGEIRVNVGREQDGLGGWATLSVQNQGPGIPLQDLPGLSQPGYRARNVGAIPGTGFELTSVREVVEQQGGSFAIHSEEGRSTTVLVRLPL